MKLTTIFGSAIAAVGLAACSANAVTPPTARPTLSLAAAPTVAPTPTATPAPTPTATPIPTPSPSDSPSPRASPSPSAGPTSDPCGGDPAYCGSGWSVATTCAVTGTAEGGSIIITWTAGYSQAPPVLPASVTIDGNVYPVTGNPQTFGPFAAGSYTLVIGSGDNANAWPGAVVISACAVVTARSPLVPEAPVQPPIPAISVL
jgi:hypothetical protein